MSISTAKALTGKPALDAAHGATGAAGTRSTQTAGTDSREVQALLRQLGATAKTLEKTIGKGEAARLIQELIDGKTKNTDFKAMDVAVKRLIAIGGQHSFQIRSDTVRGTKAESLALAAYSGWDVQNSKFMNETRIEVLTRADGWEVRDPHAGASWKVAKRDGPRLARILDRVPCMTERTLGFQKALLAGDRIELDPHAHQNGTPLGAIESALERFSNTGARHFDTDSIDSGGDGMTLRAHDGYQRNRYLARMEMTFTPTKRGWVVTASDRPGEKWRLGRADGPALAQLLSLLEVPLTERFIDFRSQALGA